MVPQRKNVVTHFRIGLIHHMQVFFCHKFGAFVHFCPEPMPFTNLFIEIQKTKAKFRSLCVGEKFISPNCK